MSMYNGFTTTDLCVIDVFGEINPQKKFLNLGMFDFSSVILTAIFSIAPTIETKEQRRKVHSIHMRTCMVE